MTCGGIQKESRPITVCHWMSHWTPQLETNLAPRSPHSAARLHASDASAMAAVAAEAGNDPAQLDLAPAWSKAGRSAIQALGSDTIAPPAAKPPSRPTVRGRPQLINL